jgi:hypothetical protein
MSPKAKRKISKGTGKRFASTKPSSAIDVMPRIRPPAPSHTEQVLRKRIPEYAFKSNRFITDIQKAMALYFEQKITPNTPLAIDENELPGFQEWLFFDFVTHTGRRIIELFQQEVGPSLNSEQRTMLEDWLVWNQARLLEFQEVTPGVGVVVQDLLSGEIFEVNDISASYSMSRWMFGLFRPICTNGRVHFTGTATPLSPFEKADILKTAQELWKKYQKKHPAGSLADFYRDNSLTLYRAIKHAQEEASRPPIPLSAEGHQLVISRAKYRLNVTSQQVEVTLDNTEEFVYAGPSEDQRGALHYNWIQRGRSVVPHSGKPAPKRAVMLRTEWTEGPGKPRFLNLGDLTLGPKSLELECLSRERLFAGKALIEEILAGLVRHLSDQFNKYEPGKEENDIDTPRRRKLLPREKRDIEDLNEELVKHLTAEWLDKPSIGGKQTPRQAVQDPAGRKKVIEALKQIEYLNNQRALDGKGLTMDVGYIRKELGLLQDERRDQQR